MIYRYYGWQILWTAFVFLLFLSCLFFTVDYALKGHLLSLNPSQYFIYYLCLIYRHFDLLVPFSCLFSSLRVLLQAGQRSEWIAIQSLGISLQKALCFLPLFGLVGFLFMIYAQEELYPKAMSKIYYYESFKKSNAIKVQSFYLEDGKEVVYKTHDLRLNQTFDNYPICSFDEIYRIQTLSLTTPLKGKYVDYFRRNHEGELELIDSWESKIFWNFNPTKEKTLKRRVSLSSLSLRDLLKKLLSTPSTQEGSVILSVLLQKLASSSMIYTSWLLPVKGSTYFQRNRKTLPTVIFNLLFLSIMLLSLNALAILSKSLVLSPFATLILAFLAMITASISFWYA